MVLYGKEDDGSEQDGHHGWLYRHEKKLYSHSHAVVSAASARRHDAHKLRVARAGIVGAWDFQKRATGSV